MPSHRICKEAIEVRNFNVVEPVWKAHPLYTSQVYSSTMKIYMVKTLSKVTGLDRLHCIIQYPIQSLHAVEGIFFLLITVCNVIFYRFPSHTISVDAKRSEKQKVIQDWRKKLMNKELEGRLASCGVSAQPQTS